LRRFSAIAPRVNRDKNVTQSGRSAAFASAARPMSAPKTEQRADVSADVPTWAPAPSDAIRARIFLVALCFGWGVTWPMMSLALRDIPPFSMRVASLILGAITLVTVARLQGRSLRVRSGRTWAHLGAASLFNIVLFSVFTPLAQLHADTSRVAVIVYTMPVWTALLARPILGERLTPTQTVALLFCIAGMAALIYPLALLEVPVGILFAIGASVSWAAGTVYLKWAKLDDDPMTVAVWQVVIGFVVMGAALPMVEGSLQLGQARLTAILALVFAGVVGSGISNFLWFDIVRCLPATTASLGVLSSPAIGVMSSMLILGERPTLADIVGFALMFAASACVVLRPQEPATPVRASP
jgi:drug/metabolite transporter (DMT)-like permease